MKVPLNCIICLDHSLNICPKMIIIPLLEYFYIFEIVFPYKHILSFCFSTLYNCRYNYSTAQITEDEKNEKRPYTTPGG